jgi:hypothetical protein
MPGFRATNSRKAVKMKKHHHVENVRVEHGILSLVVDGTNIERNLRDISPLLAAARTDEQMNFEISPSGYGIHWPLIDEDISIDGLLGIQHKPGTNRKSA